MQPVRSGPVNILFLIGAGAGFLAVLFGCIAVGTNNWYEISVDKVGTMTTGIFKECVPNKDCDTITYDVGPCVTGESRSSSEFKTRLSAVAAMIILGILTALGGGIASGVCFKFNNKNLWIVAVVLMVLATATFGSGLVVYAATLDDWLNCGRSYCSGRPCSSNFGYSFALAATALAISFANVFVVAFGQRGNDVPQNTTNPLVTSGGKGPNPDGNFNPAQGTAGGASPTQYQQQQPLNNGAAMQQMQPIQQPKSTPANQPSAASSTPAATKAATEQPPAASTTNANTNSGIPALPEGLEFEDEWQYDPEHNLYWSDRQQLYLDPNSNQYYDPGSEQWYNPETGEWYAVEGQ
eukprot:PhF_6_TR26561/c0_g1_i1/m.38427